MIRVAIDGPAGVGKSSTSKALAKYFDYRIPRYGRNVPRLRVVVPAQSGIDLDAETVDERVITETVGEFFTGRPFRHLRRSGRSHACTPMARTSARRSVPPRCPRTCPRCRTSSRCRHVLIAAQRAYIAREASLDSFSGGLGVVAEGRDITTVVAPDAEVRILLTAREEVRQARRTGQAVKGVGAEDVAARDKADSKVTSFLSAADGVTTIDNSDMDFEHTLDVMIKLIEDAIENQEYERYAANLEGYDLDEGDEELISGRGFEDGARKSGPKPVGVLAIVGRPNVGKSSLVNRILGRRAAVVEDTPGVTRDRVSYDAEWAGTDFKLVDTGGWEADVEGIESAIASQAQVAVTLADAVVFVVDGQVGMTTTDERIVKMLRASGKPVVLAVNKIDDNASEYLAAEFWKLGLGEPYSISAMHGRGVGDLLDVALGKLKEAEKASGYLTPSGLRRVALVGRPNVGKSSLLNQLARSERAVVNDLAGTTRDPVDEIVDIDGEDWLFIDTAGIKRRQHKLTGAEYYSSLRTQAAIERSELALILFDASQPISDQDLKVMSTAVDAGRAIVLVFNKWDAMDEFDKQRLERLWNTEFDRVMWAERVNLSAKTGWHTNRLARAMNTALESWDQRIPTGKLNAFLGRIQAAHPHPLRGGKQPRILFATQASTRPPRFVIFATGFLEHGYRRYIERQLREEFGFEGTPIQISVNIREKKRK